MYLHFNRCLNPQFLLALCLALVTHPLLALAQDSLTAGDLAVIKSANSLGFDLLPIFSTDKEFADKNFVYSPSSVWTAFSMLSEGARGKTASQLRAALHMPSEKGSNAAHFKQGIASVQKRTAQSSAPGLELLSANGIWIDRQMTPDETFIDALSSFYGITETPTVDFSGDPQSALRAINAWSDRQTHGQIKSILNDIQPDTAMVLGSVIYLKAAWLNRFDANQTQTKPFRVDRSPSHNVSVPLMSLNPGDSQPYMETRDFQMTLLPYGSADAKGSNPGPPAYMLIVLPKRVDGIGLVSKMLTKEAVNEAYGKLALAKLHIELPRFSFDSDIDLSRMMPAVGITDAFNKVDADFTGIASATAEKLYVSRATQRAVIRVNEEGTEAAAVTSIQMGTFGGAVNRAKPIDFIADHPFFFLIVLRETNQILFIGRVSNPML